MKIIPGSQIAQRKLDNLKQRIEVLETKPKLGIVQVGFDKPTEIYVSHKINDAKAIGIDCEHFVFDQISFDEIQNLIKNLNYRNDIHGYIIQLPISIDGDLKKLVSSIIPSKDIDGMNPKNLGLVWQSSSDFHFVPATVLGVLECLLYTAIYDDAKYSSEETDREYANKQLSNYLQGKDIVIINDSIIVGRPLAGVLLNQKASVSICNKYTKNLTAYLEKADIVVSATGVAELIHSEQVKNNAVLIDVGISRTQQGLKGDFKFESFFDTDCWITPVPNGVGPLTRVMLLENLYTAFIHQVGK